MRATERNPGHNGGPRYDTATLWIKDVAAEDTGSELVSLPPNCFFAFQVDESTHGTRLTALLVFVRCSPQLTIKERWFFYLSAWQKAHVVLRQSVLSTSFESHNLFWNKHVDMYSDGAGATVGKTVSARSWIPAMALGDQEVRKDPALHSHTITGAEEKTTSQPPLGVVIEDDWFN